MTKSFLFQQTAGLTDKVKQLNHLTKLSHKSDRLVLDSMWVVVFHIVYLNTVIVIIVNPNPNRNCFVNEQLYLIK